MKGTLKDQSQSRRIISVYELTVWVLYATIYKYALTLESHYLPRMHLAFPFPGLMLYALCSTLYIIPYYRIIAPWLLDRKKFVLLFFVSILYFILVPKYVNLVVTYLFLFLETNPQVKPFLKVQANLYLFYVQGLRFPFQFLITDMLAFFSVMFLRFAMNNEYHRYQLSKDNLTLQLETLKAQLHPHFLFNTLNSIYGMSLTGAKETPAFILRLSDMMRYILYDCKQEKVPLGKDIAFLEDYLEMEKKRYPAAQISFEADHIFTAELSIAPLLLIPFMENSFKHGAHRVNDNAIIDGSVQVNESTLVFRLSNSVLQLNTAAQTIYGGVGIENVKKRLELYYPGKHTLTIQQTTDLYIVHLTIQLAL